MNRRGNFTFGVVLILVGIFFTATNLNPDLGNWIRQYADWPYFIVGGGVVMLIAAITSGVYGLAVPSMVLVGVGNILAYQVRTGEWEIWIYAWTLVLVSIGVGVFIKNVLKGQFKKGFREGGNLVITGSVGFLILSTFFRSIFNQDQILGNYWPIILIIAGIWELLKPALSNRKKKESASPSDDSESMIDVEVIDMDTVVEVEETLESEESVEIEGDSLEDTE